MIHYSHTQTSPLVPPLAAGVLGIVVLAAVLTGGGALVVATVLISGALIAFVALIFSRLTVDVAVDHLRVAFGAGWPARTIGFADIASASTVRNSWWYGWGMRWIPGGWLWNVWGLDAVELQMISGRRFRIGTDEPAQLLAALGVGLSLG